MITKTHKPELAPNKTRSCRPLQARFSLQIPGTHTSSSPKDGDLKINVSHLVLNHAKISPLSESLLKKQSNFSYSRTGSVLTPVTHVMSCYFDFAVPGLNVSHCVYRSTVKSSLPQTYENDLNLELQNAAGALLGGGGIMGCFLQHSKDSAIGFEIPIWKYGSFYLAPNQVV